MSNFRLEITKGEEIRYISHLDYAALMERAVRRAKLPVAYSEGFNPHMKIAFASALAVGVTSDAEYMDIELTKPVCQPEFFDKLRAVLPPGVKLLRAREFTGKVKALMAAVELADYEIQVPCTGDFNQAQTGIVAYNKAIEATYTRNMLKRVKTIEVKQYMHDKIIAAEGDNGTICLQMQIKITPAGSIKPGEILEVLRDQFSVPIAVEAATINRRALYGAGKPLIDLV
ncbi:MAG: TIGR03936 family radical SAM-associated protein [Selenomonadaceae bacterium]